MSNFIFFWGINDEHGYLSQWYPSKFKHDDILFESCEHYMMYNKAILFDDYDIAKKILNTKHPKDVKQLGRKIKGFNDNKWDKHKFNIVYNGNLHKFTQNKKLKEKLISTGDKILVEASPYDKIWGIGLRADDKNATNMGKWKGQNLLGKALMKIREKCNE